LFERIETISLLAIRAICLWIPAISDGVESALMPFTPHALMH
jgi:hypothetical protein